MLSDVWDGRAAPVLREFGLSHSDLDPSLPLVFVTQRAVSHSAGDVVAAAENLLVGFRDYRVVTGVVVDVLSDRDQIALRADSVNSAAFEPEFCWKIFVFTPAGWHGFLMERESRDKYEWRFAESFEEILSDADEIG